MEKNYYKKYIKYKNKYIELKQQLGGGAPVLFDKMSSHFIEDENNPYDTIHFNLHRINDTDDKWLADLAFLRNYTNLIVPAGIYSHSIVKHNNNYYYYYTYYKNLDAPILNLYDGYKNLDAQILNLSDGIERKIYYFSLEEHKFQSFDCLDEIEKGIQTKYLNNRDDILQRIGFKSLGELNIILKNDVATNAINILTLNLFQQKNYNIIFNKIINKPVNKDTDIYATDQYYFKDKLKYFKYFVQCDKNKWRESENWETIFFNIAWKNNTSEYFGKKLKNRYTLDNKENTEIVQLLIKIFGAMTHPEIHHDLNMHKYQTITICENNNIRYLCFLNNNQLFILNLKNGEYRIVLSDIVSLRKPEPLSSDKIKEKINFILTNLKPELPEYTEYSNDLKKLLEK
jgi:hypothetical protein